MNSYEKECLNAYEANKEAAGSLFMGEDWGTFNRFCPRCFWRGGHNSQYCPECGASTTDYPKEGITWAAYIEKAHLPQNKTDRKRGFGFRVNQYGKRFLKKKVL